MDVFEAIKTRRSIREFKPAPLSRGTIEEIVDAGRFAPTARAVQPWEFVVVTRKELLRRLGAVIENGRFIAQAAACIAVFCADTKYYLEDGCAAVQNILLAARASRVGSCWIAGDKKDYCGIIAELLVVPPFHKLVAIIALGVPRSDKEFREAKRRSLDEVLHWEKF